MLSAILLGALALPVYWAISTYLSLQKNIKAAKLSGLPYVVSPIFIYHPFWVITNALWVPLIRRFVPDVWTESWLKFLIPDWNWHLLFEPFDKLGDIFLIASPQRTSIWSSNAEANTQIISRRDAFPKPLETYRILNVYGRNVVTTEGAEWRMHRKAASFGFNEKNSALVFKESIGQTLGMLKLWTGENGNGNITLTDVASDTMRATLHIISRVGFGVRLLWDGEQLEEAEKQLNSKYGSDEIPTGFSMTFKDALATVLENLFLVLLAPRWLLKNLPMKSANEALEAFDNWGLYMKTLYKQRALERDNGIPLDGMDIMGSLVRSEAPATPVGTKGAILLGLSETEIIGNAFIMLLAGHETTANTIHFALVELAINPSSQRNLQKDVESIFGNTPSEEWDYDRDINKCLGGMPGAVLNELLRLMPPVSIVPKSVNSLHDETIVVDGKKCVLPKGAWISLNAIGVQRNPRYWPSRGPSSISDSSNDLDDFYPERWLTKENGDRKADEDAEIEQEDVGGFTGPDVAASLFRPVRGSFIPFSEGPRSCLGRRIAQVEVATMLAVIFQKYSVELAVDEWATDEEVDKMTIQERRILYQKAQAKARATIRTCTTTITLKLQEKGAHIPLRLVRKGDERFVNVIS